MTATPEGPRKCAKDETSQVIAIVDAAMRQGSDQTFFDDYPLVYGAANLDRVRIITVDGNVVSVVPYYVWNAAAADWQLAVGVISGTATSQEHRMQGYGLKCLNSCVEKMIREQIDISVLWTDVPTFRFYEHSCYQAVRPGNFVFVCTREDARCFTDHGEILCRVELPNEEQLREIRSMHEQNNWGLLRGPEHYRVFFNLPKMKTLLARREGKAVAYLVVSGAENKPGLIEAAGDPRAVETLVRHALIELAPNETILIHDDEHGTAFGPVLQQRLPGDRESQPYQSGLMVRINNNRTFLQKISPWLVKKNGGRKHRFSLAVAERNETISFDFTPENLDLGATRLDSHVELSQREFTSVMFGCHPDRHVETPEPMTGLFGFSFPLRVLDRS